MRKIAALCLVMVMTLSAAWAQTEVVAYTLTPASGSNNSYTGDCDITIGEIIWNLTGNSTTNPWRIGGKSITGVDRTLYSKTAIADNVSKIEVTHGAASSITVNSWTLEVASDADFSNIISTLTPTFESNATTTISRPEGVDWSNCYYRFTYNVTVSSTSNKFLEFSEAKFYKVSDGTPPTTYTVTFDAGDGTFNGNTDFPNITNSKEAGTYTLPSAERNGYTFDGWLLTGGTDPLTGSYTVSSDVDFTAQYTENIPPTPGGDLTLTFDLSSNPGEWPTIADITLTDYTYTLNDVDYTFTLSNVKCNNGYLMIYYVGAVGLPAIEGYKLTKVVAKNSSTCSASTQVGISSSASSASYIDGGNVQTWSTTNSSYTYNLTSTEENTMYYLYVTNKNAQVIELALTYEIAAAPSVVTPTFAPANGTEFGNEGLSVTISCETEGANIYYTLDGTTPDNTSTSYDGAIYLTTTTTIKAIAYDGTDYSNVATATYTYVDPNAPGTQNNPYTVAQARAAIDANTGTQGVYATGVVSEIVTPYNSEYGNITYNISADGQTSGDQLQAYRGKSFNGENFNSANDIQVGATVIVYGNLKMHTDGTYEFEANNQLVSYIAPVVVDPSITVADATINAPYTGAEGTLIVTYENITEVAAEIYFCDANGEAAAYDWITAEINSENNVDYQIEANEGEARTAYFKVFANNVYSDLVTVSQEAPVVPEPPHFTWDLSIASYDEIEDPDIVTWSSDFATMTNSSENGGTSASNYLGGDANNRTSSRFYSGNTLTITPAVGYSITSVEFSATSNNYADALQNSAWTNATATVDEQKVTVTPTDGLSAMSATIGATCGFTGVTVYYVEDHTPVIVAGDVTVAFDATNGSINYTINNPAEGGALSASTTATWITLGDAVDNAVAFTCEANELTEDRTATVTLTYTYNTTETVTKDVTVTQGAAPEPAVIYSTIPALFEAATNTEESVLVTFDSWIVSGVSTNGKNVYVTDGTNGFIMYFNTDMSETYSAGNILTGEAVACTLKLFNGSAELLHVNAADLVIVSDGAELAPADIEMSALAGVNTGALVSYENLTCSVDNNKYYLSDGTTTLQVYNSLYAFDALDAGHVYNIKGVYQQYNSTKEILPRNAADIEEVISQEPSITVSDATINASFTGAVGTLNVTYENITEIAAEVYFCDAEGAAASYDWITAEINSENNVEYSVQANEGEARTAYFKVYVATVGVYSDLVTVTQSAQLITASFTKVSSVGAVQSGKKYILVCPTAVQNELPAPTAATSTVSNSALQTVNVTIGDDGIITTPLNGDGYPCTITFEAAEDGYYIHIGEKYLNNTSSTSISLANNGSSVWVPDLYNGEVILKNSSNNNRFLGGADATATSYKAYATSNLGSYPVVVLYQEQESVECGILLNAENPIWERNFDDMTTVTTPKTGVSPDCWSWINLVTVDVPDTVVPIDTVPFLYYGADRAHSGSYSLRSHFRGINVMPVLDEESVDIQQVKLGFWVKQPHWFYPMQVGVMTDPEDASTFVPVAYVDNGHSTDYRYYEINFAGYTGEGRYIAFKHIVPDATSRDIHSVNFIDDITLSLIQEGECTMEWPYTENFDDLETAPLSCWELVNAEVTMRDDKLPMVYNEGTNYSLQMADRCVYALPLLPEDVEVTSLQLSMDVRQPNMTYQLEVGVWDGTTFEPVALVNNSVTDYVPFSCDFSRYAGEGRRIAFRNTLNNGVSYNYSYNYIDNIELTTVAACAGPVSLPYEQDFEGFELSTEPTCWELVQVQEGVTMRYDKYPQVYTDGGDKCLRLADRCVYALPEIPSTNSVSELTLELTVRQPNVTYQLEVGVWDGTTFEPVKLLNNTDLSEHEATVDFSSYDGEGRRIALRNTLNNGVTYSYSYNYIDEVNLHVTGTKSMASGSDEMDAAAMDSYLNNIAVYPNPTTGVLHIDAMDVQKVECYSQMGQLVGVYDNVNELNISELANGVYMLRITVPQGVTMRKVVKR